MKGSNRYLTRNCIVYLSGCFSVCLSVCMHICVHLPIRRVCVCACVSVSVGVCLSLFVYMSMRSIRLYVPCLLRLFHS